MKLVEMYLADLTRVGGKPPQYKSDPVPMQIAKLDDALRNSISQSV